MIMLFIDSIRFVSIRASLLNILWSLVDVLMENLFKRPNFFLGQRLIVQLFFMVALPVLQGVLHESFVLLGIVLGCSNICSKCFFELSTPKFSKVRFPTILLEANVLDSPLQILC